VPRSELSGVGLHTENVPEVRMLLEEDGNPNSVTKWIVLSAVVEKEEHTELVRPTAYPRIFGHNIICRKQTVIPR
jgi:hypothetical protein